MEKLILKNTRRSNRTFLSAVCTFILKYLKTTDEDLFIAMATYRLAFQIGHALCLKNSVSSDQMDSKHPQQENWNVNQAKNLEKLYSGCVKSLFGRIRI